MAKQVKKILRLEVPAHRNSADTVNEIEISIAVNEVSDSDYNVDEFVQPLWDKIVVAAVGGSSSLTITEW